MEKTGKVGKKKVGGGLVGGQIHRVDARVLFLSR